VRAPFGAGWPSFRDKEVNWYVLSDVVAGLDAENVPQDENKNNKEINTSHKHTRLRLFSCP
jgi:hypothetical protein